MADTTQTSSFPLASYGADSSDGSTPTTGVDNAAGASGSTSDYGGISRGGLIALILVVVLVMVIGIASMVLFYVAKKREWKVRERIRRSARKVVQVLTPRRSEFPKSVKDGRPGSSRGRVRLDDVPPTPRLPEDLEKGLEQKSKTAGMKIKLSNFSRK